jgi:hypothetical protein
LNSNNFSGINVASHAEAWIETLDALTKLIVLASLVSKTLPAAAPDHDFGYQIL